MARKQSALNFGDIAANYAPTLAQGMVMEEELYDHRRELKKAKFAGAKIETGGFVSEYVIPGLSTVMADGTESKLMVGLFETESKLQIHVKPQISTKAIVATRVRLLGDAPIFPGQVNLFRDGAYIGQMNLPLLRPGEESKLVFGIDDQVSVERNVMKDKSGEAGVIVKDSVLERHFLTVIKNLHNKPIDLVVFETIPVAQNERIKVEVLKKSTTHNYEEDAFDTKGLLSWERRLKAKEETKIRLGWKVSWPKDHSISGL